VPQVYYVGLLAGENDQESAEKSGEGRDINRHNYSLEEIDQAVKKDVVQRLLKLIQFRNDYPAFNGEFKVLDSEQGELHLSWKKNEKKCSLKINLEKYQTIIEYMDDQGKVAIYSV
jgi:sucrose phosphorylase